MMQRPVELSNIELMTEFILTLNSVYAIKVYDDGDEGHKNLLARLKQIRAELDKRKL